MADQDAPQPPGSPMRTDAPDAPVTPGEPVLDPGPEVTRVTRDDDKGQAASPTAAQRGQDPDARALQEENAETSMDEPSDGSGGE